LGAAGLIAAACLAGSPVLAAEDQGWYIGANIGQSAAKLDHARIYESLANSGVTVTSIDDDDRDLGYKLFGGYQFNRNFALEGGYFDLGEFNLNAQTQPPGTFNGNIGVRGINLDAVGMLPFSERFSGFGRVGLTYAEADTSFAGTGLITVLDSNPKEKDVQYKFGAGLQYDVSPALGVRLEAERYRVNDAVGNKGDIDLYSLGVVYRFGTDQPKPVRTVAAPVSRQDYCSALDIQYEINQHEIQREEVDKLRVVSTYLKRYPGTTASVLGHTDNVGTSADNLRLSRERAQHVVDYLVNQEGIARNRLTAIGYGETRPIADNRTQEGQRMNRRIQMVIECVSDIAGLTPLPARITVALEMEYDIDQAAVRPRHREDLRRVADYLKANPRMTATVEGHASQTRETATAEQAMRLSQQRAQNVVNYLVEQFNVPRNRLTAEGFGDIRRIAYGPTAEAHRENRRVNIILNYPR
jgi:OOP family OmpA-OmpF porin